jgi:hypothetical protein
MGIRRGRQGDGSTACEAARSRWLGLGQSYQGRLVCLGLVGVWAIISGMISVFRRGWSGGGFDGDSR